MIEDLWYKNTVFYSLDLETFMDGNADGVGDFKGLSDRLDYLHSLGIDAIWLAPFQPTPNRDNGYDICDYYGVDPRHGSSGDFVDFMHQADKRGMKVIIDLVVNHTSIDHRWFQEARRDSESPYRNWYVWRKKRPADWNTGMVFPGVQHSTWTRDKAAGAYYRHRFFNHQPDLNIENPAVRAEIRRIIGYWLQLGVAGFRVDAVPFLIETTADGEEGELCFEYLAEMHRFLQWRRGDAILLGEANVLPQETRPYLEQGGMHMMFNFYVNQYVFHALASGTTARLSDALEATRDIPETSQWATFLRNHDELDLGRLTEEERALVFSRFAPEPGMQLYERGIRRRLAPMLGDRAHLELAYSLLFALPGTPVLRYGDEIGMGDDLNLSERDAVRTPMQWADAPCGGFTAADQSTHPVIETGVWAYPRVNVEAQRRDPDSMLNWTARMIRLRKETPEIGWGLMQVIPTDSPHVLVLRYDWQGAAVLIAHNFDSQPHEVLVHLDAANGTPLVDLLIEAAYEADERGAVHLALDAYAYRWFRLGGLNYAARRSTCV